MLFLTLTLLRGPPRAQARINTRPQFIVGQEEVDEPQDLNGTQGRRETCQDVFSKMKLF